MRGMKLLAGFSMLLGLIACRGDVSPAKLSGKTSLRLADGSPISQASTDEYNPYLVKMADGYLVLVFGSDRACAGCSAGTHNLFLARSVSVYNDDAKLPTFNAPVAFTVASNPVNDGGRISFAAVRNSAQLRIYLMSSGIIKYADVNTAGAPYNVAALTSIAHFGLSRTTLLGIDATGSKLVARASGAAQAFYFDPTRNTGAMTKNAVDSSTTSVIQVPANHAGIDDAFFALVNGAAVSATHAASGAAHTQLNTTFATAKVTPRFMTVLYAGSKEGTLVALSAAGAGGTLDDLYILEGTSAGMLWEQQSSKPQSGAATAPVWVQPQLTATRVYGQNGLFTCAVVNNNNSGCTSGGGTPNDKSLYRGSRPAISDDGLYIADQLNNRALFFSGISTTATRVYCQAGSFTTATFGTVPGSQTCRGNPSYGNVSSVFVDSSGVYVNDIEANRVLFFAGANIDAASGLGGRIYGQGGNYTTFAAGTTAQTFTNPDTTTSDIDGIYISDTNNNRVLFYSGTSTTATRVYGQNGNFNTNTGSVSADGLSGPRGVAIAPDGIYIADNGNNRVLFYPGTSTTATRVYGQSNMTSNTAGGGASSLNWPWGVKYFGGGIYVVDYNNHRVLFFPENSGTATHVWGQNGSFTANSANQGGSVSATSLNNPYAVDVDHTGMYVGDNQNHRVVFYPR